jgi:hypothetical protein
VETLLEALRRAAAEVERHRDRTVVLVVATQQPAVAQLAQAVAEALRMPLYLTNSVNAVGLAQPARPLTTTERETLQLISQLGGSVTVNQLATRGSLEITAAGNRLARLARNGYVNRVSRSRREGDEYFSPAWFADVEAERGTTAND